MSSPRATVLISTKNRRDEACRAIESAVGQSAECEVLVIDDGSTDGTAEEIAKLFPTVRVIRREPSAGYIVRRNEGAALASAPIIVSIDDDATFSSRFVVEQALTAFENPRVGATAIPFVNVRQSPAVHQAAPPGEKSVTATFIGTAHALRRDLFLRLGGYRPLLFHQGEESDYCLRMLAAGYVTLLVPADPIHHFESPKRDLTRMDVFGRRNDVLFATLNVPALRLLPHLAATTVNGLRHGLREGRTWNMVRGLSRGYGASLLYWRDRRPVPRAAYDLFRKLKKSGPMTLSKVEPLLPTLV
jgi:glycosyltransferase involved in cell wall biosynthesis